MVAGLAVCLVLYQVYVFFLGGYDGLTPLPPEYWPNQSTTVANNFRDTPSPEPPVVRKLRQAFGAQSKEADRPILIESVQHGVILAAQKVFLSQEGKLELEQVSVAVFGKKRTENELAEISTIQGDRAIIEFDKPLTSVRDVANRKPVAGRIEGRLDPASGKINQVHLRHNRRTVDPDDDLHLYTDWLQYDDRQHRIWTEAAVEIVDSDPDKVKITGIGLEVLLESETANKPGGRPGRATITGVRSVELSRNVQMYFQTDAGAAFLSGAIQSGSPDSAGSGGHSSSHGQAATKPASPDGVRTKKPDRRSPAKVLADGPFIYRVPEERAEFHHRVHLIRIAADQARTAETQVLDEMRCETLVLQFRRRQRDKKARSEENEAAIELVAARATGEPVEVALESENLHARGTELVFDRQTSSATLTGKPLEALYDGHRLQVMGTLVLQAQENQLRELRQAEARGPGTAWLRGRQENQIALVARWREQLQLRREDTMERLLLSGNVLLEEPQRGSLRSDHLLLWLEVATSKSPTAPPNEMKPSTNSTHPGHVQSPPAARIVSGPKTEKATRGRIPRCLEASGNVSLQSDTLIVPHTERLRIELHDETLPDHSNLAPDASSPTRATTGNDSPIAGNQPQAATVTPNSSTARNSASDVPLPASPSQTTGLSTPSELKASSSTPTNRPPLVLRARTIEAIAAGSPTRAELRVVSAQGQVQIDQPQLHQQERSLQLRCGLLHLTRTPNGDILRLEGTPAQPAWVTLGQMALRGPVIKMDQVLNTVDVEGLGSMRLPARNDFQGNPLREPTEVIVDWNQSMFFDGRLAEFDGGVQAVQGNSRLACRRLSLLLDRKISLREQKTTNLHRGEAPAALSRLMCEQDVRLEKAVFEQDRYRLLQRIEARELAYDHEQAILTAYGPGVVHVFQPAGETSPLQSPAFPTHSPPTANSPVSSTPNSNANPRQESQFKLTRIRYDGYLQASKAADKQTDIITFTGGVQLLHVSATDPDQPIDPDRLPEDGLSIACGQLKIASRKIENGSSTQELVAERGVRVRAKQFHALADRVSFDEAKDLLILEGTSGATLYRQRVPGGEFEPVRAKRIWFWRRDNRVRFDGTESIQINP